MRLGALLGVGGAACVYEAEWEGRRCAVKLLHPSSADARLLAR